MVMLDCDLAKFLFLVVKELFFHGDSLAVALEYHTRSHSSSDGIIIIEALPFMLLKRLKKQLR